MRFAVLIIFLGCVCAASGGENPDFSSLGAGSLVERERAVGSFEKWILDDQGQAKGVLLEKYLRCVDPEVRVRLLLLLERAYFPVKGFVGITMRSTLWDQLGRFEKGKKAQGVRVMAVGEGTPAEECGLKVDDLILKINDWTVEGGAEVTSLVATEIRKNSPSTPILLEVKRGEEIFRVEFKLGILPVPSVRARLLRAGVEGLSDGLPQELEVEISTFQTWITEEIEKDRKNLIADRRL